MTNTIEMYTDGACRGNPGPGGWGAVIIQDGSNTELSGHEPNTTNNRMELMAAINALSAVPENANVLLHSDSIYLINTMTKDWKKKANMDLWDRLDSLASTRTIKWEWVKGHAGDIYNERADMLATQAIPKNPGEASLTHLDKEGNARMVDVGWKNETQREAIVKAQVIMKKETLELIREGTIKKGDVLTVARIAGIMGAKQTSNLIPMCHPISLDVVSVDLEMDSKSSSILITCTAKTSAKTGVEMEAMTAASVTALTIYDMCKAVDRGIIIKDLRLVRKSGGKSGDVILDQ